MMKLPIALVLLMVSSVFSEPAQVYLIGNSLTDEVKYPEWINLCKEGGVEAVYARKMIPGSPLAYHQENPSAGFLTEPFGPPEKAFAQFTWDALTLQPFRPGEEIPALYYANLMWASNPSTRVFVYAQWPERRGSDWEAQWTSRCAAVYQPVLAALRETPQGGQVFMIPAGWVMERLHKKAQLGQVPGLTSAWDLYSDGVHVNNIASYMVALTFYATIFQKSPIGLPVGEYQGKQGTDSDHFDISPELARIIQETVWETVAGHPDSGVLSGEPPAITSVGLPDAVEGEPYRYAVDASFGHPPYTFAVVSGQLPDGMVISSEGVLAGIPTAQGAQSFALQVTDQRGVSAQRTMALNVGEDLAPKVVTPALPALRQGEFINLQLASEGGNGFSRWAVTGGVLPPGLRLSEGGRLDGSPAVSGDYSVTLTVHDGDGGQPESDTRTFSGRIAPADLAKVFLVRQAKVRPNVDTMLDPAEGWNLATELKRPYAGEPNNKVRFDAQWYASALYMVVEVEDDSVITQEGYGPPHQQMDCLAYFFDGLNNREATYNFDDRRLAYGPTPVGQDDRKWNMGPAMAAHVRVERRPTGYRMKTQFDFHNIAVPDQDLGTPGFQAAGAVFGFDLVNYDLDEKGGAQTQLGWQGSAKNPDDPSGFGTMILMP